jgi:Flp pilus assembly protein TadB
MRPNFAGIPVAWWVGVLVGIACALWLPGSRRPTGAEPSPELGRVPVAIVVGVVVGAVVATVSGTLAGCAFGATAAFGWLRLRLGMRPGAGRSGAPGRRTRDLTVRQLPAALDLLAACLAAGAIPGQALVAVGAAFEGEVGAMLSGVAALTALGAPIEKAWSHGSRDPRWASVARALIRAHYSGAALTDVLEHLADDRRRAIRTNAQAAAQRAGIKAVLPLGVCFLPAFVLVGVVPVVAGFAQAMRI